MFLFETRLHCERHLSSIKALYTQAKAKRNRSSFALKISIVSVPAFKVKSRPPFVDVNRA